MSYPARQRGFLTLAAVALIALLGVFVAILAYMIVESGRASADLLGSTQALYAAESGLQRGINNVTTSDFSARLSCVGLSTVSAVSLGAGIPGTYDLTGDIVFANPVATLSAAISASATIIPMTSVANYNADGGRVLIDREAINYASVSTNPADCGSAPCLLGAQRGVDGSQASAHALGAPVGQYQCNISSTGEVAGVGLNNKRTLVQATQLEEAWAVGRDTGGEVFLRWSGTSWLRDGPYGGIPNRDLRAIYMLSYADGWAVGQDSGNRPIIVHWDGGGWTRVIPAGPSTGNRDLFGITCVAHNDCWTVGQKASGNGLIYRWNGTNWSRVTPAPAANANLRAVDCISANDCWAVGDQLSNRPTILRWNGASWTRILPAGGPINQRLNAVSCTASNNCWAVGNDQGGQALFMRWNGATWVRVNVPGLPAQDFTGVSCTAADYCWAVGRDQGGNALLANWNGASWSRVLPDGTVPSRDLFGVYCATEDNCWAVGQRQGGKGLMIHWDGNAWSRDNSAEIPNIDIWAVFLIAPHGIPQAAWFEDYH